MMTELNQHPLRDLLEKELQQRLYPPLTAPVQVCQWMFTLAPSSRASEFACLQQYAAAQGLLLQEGDVDLNLPLGDVMLRWERHSEFSTYSFIRTAGSAQFIEPTAYLPAADWFAPLPGQLFRVVQLLIVPADGAEQAMQQTKLPGALAQPFADEHLISSLIADGQARIWTDFRKHPEGAGRMLLAIHQPMAPSALGRLVQQLFDLGNYRKLSLLAFPAARQALGQLHQLEQQLAAITQQIEHQKSPDELLLQQISLLSAQTEHLIASNSARLDACHAYYQLTLDRLKALGEQRVAGLMTLQDFSERRLTPAWRTARSVQSRQLNLSARLGRSTELLRTRINLQLQRQNTSLLASMAQRARLQLNLQRSVERISVVAISYYAVQLVDKGLLSLSYFQPELPLKLLQSLSLPLVIGCTALLLWRLHKRALRQSASADATGSETAG
jgi:uncharacterized membrane-anchored protein